MDVNGQNLDPTATPAITDSINHQVGMSNQGLANSYSSNAGQGLLNLNTSGGSGTAFQPSAESAAIRNRYMPQFNRSEQQLSLDNLKGAQEDHIRNLQVATAAAGQEVELNKQKAILKDKIDQANKKARGAVLGTVLGIVGGVVAGIYTGGTGAAAGYAAGNAAGNAIGG